MKHRTRWGISGREQNRGAALPGWLANGIAANFDIPHNLTILVVLNFIRIWERISGFIKMEFKSRQLSFKQKEVLVDFVYARPDMYKGKLTATYTNAIGIRLWKEVTCILNGIPGGATKDWKQWRKVVFLSSNFVF